MTDRDPAPEQSGPRAGPASLLGTLEQLGNRLPHPITLFALGALCVMALSQVAVTRGWSVESAKGVVEPVSLLSSDGLFWAFSSSVDNFKNFPPLAIVLVGMLGIGLAERSGFLPNLLRASLSRVAPVLLTPMVFFVGVLSSLTLDAGYVVLPPIAATLYAGAGRSPLAGIAVVFAGVSAGFSANLWVTGLDPMLAGLSTSGAQIVDPKYHVAATANVWFLFVSTFLLTAAGWAVTALFVEPRLAARSAERGGPSPRAADDKTEALSKREWGALRVGVAAFGATALLFLALTWIPGAPLHGDSGRFPRWVEAIIPILFVSLFVPGLAYGIRAGTLRSDRDVATMLGDTMASMGPYIVMAFFAAQFIAYFAHSHLGEMLAVAGGNWLVEMALPPAFLVVAFVATTALANLLIGSMSAKYAFFAPVFVPMFMQVGISPELTQAAYRVGDSVTNVITPLNPYLVIILVLLQRYDRNAGFGTLVSLMLPYALAFGVVWTALLLLWMGLGLPLGPAGPLWLPGH
jgi:aminobenzoyl-glutamate transport protein